MSLTQNNPNSTKISKNDANLITPYKYILIQDNKGIREFCIVHNKKVKISKKHIDLSFFENKKLNTFWEIGLEISPEISPEITEISSKEFFRDDICI